ncbi:gamma-glutamylcyclotransferase family protein [Chlamydia abortus]|uniref:gamma-glutamylcyclotransferase family protein n=1 Tax=Chlamydia abortus TaxID=83555 RepID=UPI00091A4CC5|nr:gamma-glutamylcyclotransferase family protein [Chlamydia abortus]SGA01402.1 lipoprotein [Chlamydia abortus]SGA25230.1 lipoprotein [Chlamydia abortus]SGA28727.1 lipoprotein [Chlamydia abortus]SHD82844.1 lipoprotein [Chlamydia abortus]SHN95019.1 lipoprotein [Chlamydia abortus]
MRKLLIYLLGCVLLILTGCSQSISSKNSTDTLEQVFCIQFPVSDFLSYPAAYLPSQYLSKEYLDPKVSESVDNESRRIWKEIHTKMQLTTPYIPIVVYGSLMNPISAQHTLQEYYPHAVWLHNYVRVYNLDIRLFESSFRVTDADGEDNHGALNLKYAPGKRCNGIVLALGEDDFVACRRREGVYDCIPVVVSDYISSGQCKHSVAYAWIAGDQVCTQHVLPVKGYYSMIWDGITSDNVRESFGEHFSEDYLETTFLADGRSVKTIHDEYKDAPIRY